MDDLMDTLKFERLKREKKTKKRSIITKRKIVIEYLNNKDTCKDFISWSETNYPDLIVTLYDLLKDFRSDDKSMDDVVYHHYPDNSKHHLIKRKLYHLPKIGEKY
jgi:hypothetical protein